MNNNICIFTSLSLAILLAPILIESFDHEPILFSEINEKYSDESANFTSSGESGILISGEPANLGDPLRAAVLVGNSGNTSGSAWLFLENLDSGENFTGDPVHISPGSTREIYTFFHTNISGINIFNWSILTISGEIESSDLIGQFSIQASKRQTLETAIESYNWDEDNGLTVHVSISLSEGKSRQIQLLSKIGFEGSIQNLQQISVSIDPGRRLIELYLGHPLADYLEIEAIPSGWELQESSTNISEIEIFMPIIDSSLLSISASFDPAKPLEGESVIVTITLQNNADFSTSPGNLRLILLSESTIVNQVIVQSVNPSSSISTQIQIPAWPDGPNVDIRAQWNAGDVSAKSDYSIESIVQDQGLELPFDFFSAIIGAFSGIVIIMLGAFIWRAVSTKTPSVSNARMRDAKESTKSLESISKKEISCNYCDQRLMVPEEHVGAVKCPSCTMEFIVGEKNDEFKVVKSIIPNLNCPECDQTLRVPLDKRPVMSRCPICRVEFLAERGE
ncbi:MAG: hypothetical protein CMA12_03320 [Euryarchaeota archaeon]|nr:hypothetical protein [Euryarchaeota archaeon]OUW22522.1 MAG: hypothetical protein CBD33_01665 [Euryarchaeota archaeon TMED173]